MICEAVANDYESLASIISDVQRWAGAQGQALGQEVISEHIEKLVESGVVNAYVFDKTASQFIETRFDKIHGASYWFHARRNTAG